jgi:predicted porin
MKRRIFALIICNLFAIKFAIGQNKEFVANTNCWFMYAGNHHVSNNWSIHTLVHIRRSEFVVDAQQNLYRIGLNYYFNTQVFGSMGYDHLATFPYGKAPISEKAQTNGMWETVTLKHQSGVFKFTHRYRFAQLWNKKHTGSKFFYTHRFRYMFMTEIPLYKKVFISVFDELFISCQTNVSHTYFNQNRMYLGLGCKFDRGNFQIGFMNQLLNKSAGAPNEKNRTVMMGLNYNMESVVH